MIEFKKFTGGPLFTNAFLLESPQGNVLFDAPQGADAHFAKDKIDWLLLTHGHFDHVTDAALIQRRHGCKIAFHPDTIPMVADGNFFKKHGFDVYVEPIQADRLIEEGGLSDIAGLEFSALHVPGHCPGSLCFYFPKTGQLIGGDVLFREGVGRWDLPGGNGPLLFEGIRQKIFSLAPETIVYPGHGPETTVAHELEYNPYVAIE